MTDHKQEISITLPDGSKRVFAVGISAKQIADQIGSGLAKATIAADVNGKLVDCSDFINEDADIRLITSRDELGVEIIRHSCAHLVGHAVKQLYPNAKMVIGPVIDKGFYYDISYERPFTSEDLIAIEKRMKQLIATEYDVVKEITPRSKAIEIFKSRQEAYKLKLIDDMPDVQSFALYHHEEYIDMCLGPHVPNTRFLEHVKLTKISGAYWRGDSNNEQLQRIYGTAWATKKELKSHLKMLEEAEKRDHRKLGKALNLFHFHEEATGAVFWQPKGWVIFQLLIEYMRRHQQESGYIEVNTPDLMDRSLWETSGHWQNYQDHMYSLDTPDEKTLALKPMNCPGSVLMFNHGLKSYRDLPIRMAEFGKVHRYEISGALHGLLRVRHFTQDDAHIYCTESQMQNECTKVIRMILRIYQQLGFDDIKIKLSTRPDNRMGDDQTWNTLESALVDSLKSLELEYQLNPGEGAFYGPKLEFVLRDAIDRDWQCGTLQVDMNLPTRFNLAYISEDGKKIAPVMIHRALFGSLERFIGILIEHYEGKLPQWLSPIQIAVLTISETFNEYASGLVEVFRGSGLRAEIDKCNEKIGYKIRQQTLQKTPFMVIVGANEVATNQISVRLLDGKQKSFKDIEGTLEYLVKACSPPDLIGREKSVQASIKALKKLNSSIGEES